MKGTKPKIKLEITATVTISMPEAEILLFLTDFDLAKEFANRFSTKYSEDTIKRTLAELRTHLKEILTLDEEIRERINTPQPT